MPLLGSRLGALSPDNRKTRALDGNYEEEAQGQTIAQDMVSTGKLWAEKKGWLRSQRVATSKNKTTLAKEPDALNHLVNGACAGYRFLSCRELRILHHICLKVEER